MKKTLAAKMATIMGELSRLPKTGRNDFHKYDFLEESVLVDAVRPLLAAQGIGVSQQILEYSQDGNRSIVHLKIIYRDGDSGEEMFSTGIGEGVDKSDKGLPKATTSAFKYALKNTFLISSGDDVENDEVEAKPGRRYQGDQLDQGLKNARVRMEPKSKEGKEAAWPTPPGLWLGLLPRPGREGACQSSARALTAAGRSLERHAAMASVPLMLDAPRFVTKTIRCRK